MEGEGGKLAPGSAELAVLYDTLNKTIQYIYRVYWERGLVFYPEA